MTSRQRARVQCRKRRDLAAQANAQKATRRRRKPCPPPVNVGWQAVRFARQQQRAAPHPIAHSVCRSARDADRPRDDPRCREIARVAADQHKAAPHPVSESRARVAVDRQRAARHAFHVAGQRASGEVARVAGDGEPPAAHLAAGEAARVAVDMQARRLSCRGPHRRRPSRAPRCGLAPDARRAGRASACRLRRSAWAISLSDKRHVEQVADCAGRHCPPVARVARFRRRRAPRAKQAAISTHRRESPVQFLREARSCSCVAPRQSVPPARADGSGKGRACRRSCRPKFAARPPRARAAWRRRCPPSSRRRHRRR